MLYTYMVKVMGSYHEKIGTPCQDACNVIKHGDNIMIAAVADGLGSEAHSDIASEIAVNVSTAYCAKNIDENSSEESILRVINESFSLAQESIETEAEKNAHDSDQYDTTLTLAVLIHDTLYYGHSGDSGMVALTTSGRYEKVTEQQRDEDNCVFPLCFEDKWIFEKYENKVSAVLLATDGLFEMFFPVYIKNEVINIHVKLARFFLDNRVLKIDELGESAIQARAEYFIMSIPSDIVNDDKTVAVLINTSVETKTQPEDYYRDPDWKELKRKYDEEWKRLAYPHLYKDTE